MEDQFDLDDFLRATVRWYASKRSPYYQHLEDEEDLLFVLKATALHAISKYRADRGAKLSTWVYKCVENQLKDLMRKERTRVPLVFTAEEANTTTTTDIDALELDLTMKALLNEEEYRVLQLRKADLSVREIREATGLSTRKITECLQSTSRKYRSIDKSQTEALMRRRRQDRWLTDSARSPNESFYDPN